MRCWRAVRFGISADSTSLTGTRNRRSTEAIRAQQVHAGRRRHSAPGCIRHAQVRAAGESCASGGRLAGAATPTDRWTNLSIFDQFLSVHWMITSRIREQPGPIDADRSHPVPGDMRLFLSPRMAVIFSVYSAQRSARTRAA